MARKPRRCMTRLEIIQLASRKFLEEGYDATTVSAMAKELEISPGNLTFHFPTKEHLLAELVDLMCRFQWKWMEEAADEGIGSLMAICLELSAMAGISAEDRIIREFFLSAYTSPMCLRIIRANDTERAKKVYAEYCADWTKEQFAEAEILCSGIEYATLMLVGEPVSLEMRLSGALNTIMGIFGVPEEIRQTRIRKVLTVDHKSLGQQVLTEFREFVEQANEQAVFDLLKNK